jgi:hypothetical protein
MADEVTNSNEYQESYHFIVSHPEVVAREMTRFRERIKELEAKHEWQPIETAPRNPPGIANGPWILAWLEWDYVIYQVRWMAFENGGKWTTARGAPGLRLDDFAYWMPVPAPPEVK